MKNLVTCVLFVLTAAAWAAAQEPPTASEKGVLDHVWNALNAQPALANHHRGFFAYVSSRPGVASALDALRPLERHPVLGRLLASFSDSVCRDQELERAYQQFYAALATDESLREAADAVYRLELALDSSSLQAGCVQLKGDVDSALRFLTNPAKPAPAGLYAFKTAFKQNPPLREELLEALSALHKMPAAHTAVFPWWRKVFMEKDTRCEPYARLTAELSRQSHRFWAWHTAQIELAKDLKAWPWILHWQRRVRQDPALAGQYGAYLEIVRRRPDYGKAALDAWQSNLGPAPQWPPESPPPRPPAPPPTDPTTTKKPPRPEVKKPAAPKPHMPDMPQMPRKPEKPPLRRPDKPPLQPVQAR